MELLSSLNRGERRQNQASMNRHGLQSLSSITPVSEIIEWSSVKMLCDLHIRLCIAENAERDRKYRPKPIYVTGSPNVTINGFEALGLMFPFVRNYA